MEEQNFDAWRAQTMRRLCAQEQYDFSDLCDIVRILRAPGGCPWDQEQDHHSIRKGMIEECYEVVEAIDREDAGLLREELGDVLLQLIFHASIEEDAGRFDIHDVANDECVKMIHRHPHVFGTARVDSSAQVLENWESIKKNEKHRHTLYEQLAAIPPMLPALMRASKVQKKAWENGEGLAAEEAAAQIEECLHALRQATASDDRSALIGRLLFCTVVLSRAVDTDAEQALTQEIEKFMMSVTKKQPENAEKIGK